jgi:diguanylate cyclase (GGDEF)-like protein
MSLRGKVIAILAFPVAVLLASASLAFLAERRSANALAATQHGYQVEHEIDAVLTDLVDAETGMRGFLLTGDRDYLEPYKRGAEAVDSDLHQLSDLTKGDRAQDLRIERLQYLVTDRLTLLVNLQAFAPVNDSTDRPAMVSSMDEGKGLMDTIRSVLGEMGQQEVTVLRASISSLEEARHLALIMVVAVTPGSVLVALIIVFLSATHVVSRISRIEDNARRLERSEPLLAAGDDRDEIGELGRVLVATGAKLSALQTELRQMATVDELTGLANRRGFLAVADHQLRLATRLGEPAALLFLDLDNLKTVNDSLGHATGDQMLRETAEVMTTTFRDADLLARVGGDEFCVLMATGQDPGAKIALGRLREITARRNLEPGRTYQLGFSVGLTEFDPAKPSTVKELMDAADALMYAEKRAKHAARAGSEHPAPVLGVI